MRRNVVVLALIGGAVTVGTAALALIPPSPSAATPSPSLSDRHVEPDEVPWVFASQLPPGGADAAFVLQAGVLGEAEPRVDIEVPWAVDHNVDIARMPAVARPAAGRVLFVADDGTGSSVERVAIEAGAAPEPLFETEDAVWSVATAPDGSAAYLALVARGRPDADLGVVRLALDGSRAVEEILPPVAGAAAAKPMRLVAVAPFTVAIDVSADGRLLVRTACRGAAGCEVSVVDLDSRVVHPLPGTTVVDAGAGGMIVTERCGMNGCSAELLQVETGARLELDSQPHETTVAAADGRGVVVAVHTDGNESWLVATDPSSGTGRELYRVPAGDWIMLASRSYPITAPDGTVVIVHESVGDGDGETRHRYVVIPLAGGAPRDLAPPPIRPIGPPGAKG
jgi:hypothetical protein